MVCISGHLCLGSLNYLIFVRTRTKSSSTYPGGKWEYKRQGVCAFHLKAITVIKDMHGRLWKLVVLVTMFSAATSALRCVNCNGCSKFEDSQAVTCPPSADRCLKLHLPSGLINRECGDEKTCVDKSNDRDRFLAVHCCETNICNGGISSRHRTSSGAVLALLPLLATSFRSFCRY